MRSPSRRRAGSTQPRRRPGRAHRPRTVAFLSDLPHHQVDGQLHGATPVVAQLARWGALFDELVVCSPLLPGPPPPGFSPLPGRVRFEEVRAGGGNTRIAKLGLVVRIPGWAWRTRRLARRVDAVVLRCPSNVAAVALLSTWRAVPFRAAIYAAAWEGYPGEPRPYALQRGILASRWFEGPTLVYAQDPDGHRLEPSFSPSHDQRAWAAAAPAAEARVARIATAPPEGPWQLVVVGRLTPNKNQAVAIEALALLVARGLDVRLEVIGTGPQRAALEDRARRRGVADRVAFLGEVDHDVVLERLAAADLQLLPTRHEGYGKVLLEGMVVSVVPVLADGPAAEEIGGGGRRGIVVDASRPEAFASAVADLLADRPRWHAMATEARAYAGSRTVESFEARVREVLEGHWGVRLRDVDAEAREGRA
ncbi:MAG: glycosyltransferase family 4 protein [Acidimicrobiales bacterium]|nr:glycosyltransferase family 4 protein [Acidimicrobiales bacterium]HRW36557.1 glycosyltransferase [Aquihabitans sp.]